MELVILLQGVTEPDEVRDLEDAVKRKAQLECEEEILLQRVATAQEDFNASEEKQGQEGGGEPLEEKEAEEDEPTETEGAKPKEATEQVTAPPRE